MHGNEDSQEEEIEELDYESLEISKINGFSNKQPAVSKSSNCPFNAELMEYIEHNIKQRKKLYNVSSEAISESTIRKFQNTYLCNSKLLTEPKVHLDDSVKYILDKIIDLVMSQIIKTEYDSQNYHKKESKFENNGAVVYGSSCSTDVSQTQLQDSVNESENNIETLEHVSVLSKDNDKLANNENRDQVNDLNTNYILLNKVAPLEKKVQNILSLPTSTENPCKDKVGDISNTVNFFSNIACECCPDEKGAAVPTLNSTHSKIPSATLFEREFPTFIVPVEKFKENDSDSMGELLIDSWNSSTEFTVSASDAEISSKDCIGENEQGCEINRQQLRVESKTKLPRRNVETTKFVKKISKLPKRGEDFKDAAGFPKKNLSNSDTENRKNSNSRSISPVLRMEDNSLKPSKNDNNIDVKNKKKPSTSSKLSYESKETIKKLKMQTIVPPKISVENSKDLRKISKPSPINNKSCSRGVKPEEKGKCNVNNKLKKNERMSKICGQSENKESKVLPSNEKEMIKKSKFENSTTRNVASPKTMKRNPIGSQIPLPPKKTVRREAISMLAPNSKDITKEDSNRDSRHTIDHKNTLNSEGISKGKLKELLNLADAFKKYEEIFYAPNTLNQNTRENNFNRPEEVSLIETTRQSDTGDSKPIRKKSAKPPKLPDEIMHYRETKKIMKNLSMCITELEKSSNELYESERNYMIHSRDVKSKNQVKAIEEVRRIISCLKKTADNLTITKDISNNKFKEGLRSDDENKTSSENDIVHCDLNINICTDDDKTNVNSKHRGTVIEGQSMSTKIIDYLCGSIDTLKNTVDNLYDIDCRTKASVTKKISNLNKQETASKKGNNKLSIKIAPTGKKEVKQKVEEKVNLSEFVQTNLSLGSKLTSDSLASMSSENEVKDTVITENQNENISESVDGLFIPATQAPVIKDEDDEQAGLDIKIKFPETKESCSELSICVSQISAVALTKLRRCPKEFTIKVDFMQGQLQFQTGKGPINNLSIGPDLRTEEHTLPVNECPAEGKQSDIIFIKPSTECSYASLIIPVDEKRTASSKPLKSTEHELFSVVNLPFTYNKSSNVTQSCVTFENKDNEDTDASRRSVSSMPQIPSTTTTTDPDLSPEDLTLPNENLYKAGMLESNVDVPIKSVCFPLKLGTGKTKGQPRYDLLLERDANQTRYNFAQSRKLQLNPVKAALQVYEEMKPLKTALAEIHRKIYRLGVPLASEKNKLKRTRYLSPLDHYLGSPRKSVYYNNNFCLCPPSNFSCIRSTNANKLSKRNNKFQEKGKLWNNLEDNNFSSSSDINGRNTGLEKRTLFSGTKKSINNVLTIASVSSVQTQQSVVKRACDDCKGDTDNEELVATSIDFSYYETRKLHGDRGWVHQDELEFTKSIKTDPEIVRHMSFHCISRGSSKGARSPTTVCRL